MLGNITNNYKTGLNDYITWLSTKLTEIKRAMDTASSNINTVVGEVYQADNINYTSRLDFLFVRIKELISNIKNRAVDLYNISDNIKTALEYLKNNILTGIRDNIIDILTGVCSPVALFDESSVGSLVSSNIQLYDIDKDYIAKDIFGVDIGHAEVKVTIGIKSPVGVLQLLGEIPKRIYNLVINDTPTSDAGVYIGNVMTAYCYVARGDSTNKWSIKKVFQDNWTYLMAICTDLTAFVYKTLFTEAFPDYISTYVQAIINSIKTKITDMFTIFSEQTGSYWSYFKKYIDDVVDGLQSLNKELTFSNYQLTKYLTTFSDKLPDLLNNIRNLFSGIGNIISEITTSSYDSYFGTSVSVYNVIKSILDKLKAVVNNTYDIMNCVKNFGTSTNSIVTSIKNAITV
jgi:phage-related protein